MEVNNKKAYFDYHVERSIEAGIVLKGTEIKSIRGGSVDLKDAYVRIKKNEAFIINMYIAKYEAGNQFNHDERRTRKLLLHRKEINKLEEESTRDGFTLIPLKLYIHKGYAKVLVGVCKSKKLHDKRQVIKERDLEKEARRSSEY